MKYIISCFIAAGCCVGGWFFTRWYLNKNKSEFKKIKKLPLLITASGIIFLAVSVLFPLFILSNDMSVYSLFRTMILIYFLFFAGFIDYKLHLIPNKLLLILLGIAGLSYGAEAFIDFPAFQSEGIMALIGCAVCFVIFFVGKLISRDGMGMGDIKLSALIGLLLGLDSAIGCLLWSLMLAAVTGAVLMISKKANRKTKLPFAPFFFMGAMVSHIIFIITGTLGG